MVFSWRQDDVNELNFMTLYDTFVDSGGVDGDSKSKILIIIRTIAALPCWSTIGYVPCKVEGIGRNV